MLSKKSLIVKLLLASILLSNISAVSANESECKESVLSSYMNFRGKLLASDFQINEVLKLLKPNYLEQIKKDMVFDYFMALRVKEAKIAKIASYDVKCNRNGNSVLKLKTIGVDERFDRRHVVFKYKDGHFYMKHLSLEIGAKDFDEGADYIEIHIYEKNTRKEQRRIGE